MKLLFSSLIICIIFSCHQERKVLPKADAAAKLDSVARDIPVDIFGDSNFTFIELDSLNEDMLTDHSSKKHQYISAVKKLKKEHYDFFNYQGVQDTFFEEHFFLVSRQKVINGIKPIIVHNSLDFNYYASELFTLDKNNNKIASITVSMDGFSTGGDEPYDYVDKTSSKFNNEFITTTQLKCHRFHKDSLVTIDSTIVYSKIENDGRITTLRTEKF